jgi:uncharacterized membrane protein
MFPHMRGFEPAVGFFPFGGWLFIALAVVALVLLGWLVATAISRRGRGPAGGLDEADAILRARLARGEISPEEYAETRRVLGLK